MRAMASWIEIDREITKRFDKMRRLEEEAIREILCSADVVCATNAMVGSEAMEGMRFDLVLIDEAGQQIEPSTLIPALRGRRVIMAGDHKQLPPTVISENELLKRSLFERLMLRTDVGSQMLRVQYRMHEVIMDFPNRLMYDGRLIADASVAQRTLQLPKPPKEEALAPQWPVVFLDTVSVTEAEQLAPRSTSYENPYEAEQLVRLVDALLQSGLSAESIGVITPYLAQVKRIRKLLEAIQISGIEVKSVDGFQGREKEVILISLVRSNIAKAIGFVSDARRLNVAMTRAKSKLVMIGDRKTLEPNAPFDQFFDWLDTAASAKRFEV
jgi:predicted DNA helicase